MGQWHFSFLASAWLWRVAWQVSLGASNRRTGLGRSTAPGGPETLRLLRPETTMPRPFAWAVLVTV